MKCEEIRNLITAYIDDEVSKELSRSISGHLDSCPSCKRMEQSLRCSVINPLRKSKRTEPPDAVWYQIRDILTSKKQRLDLPGLVTQWFNLLRIKKPILIPATIMITVILLITALILGRMSSTEGMLNAYIEEQVLFLSELAENGQESYFGIDDVSLGTSIERYLL